MKNSSRLELTIERNFTRSRRGFSRSRACSSTLFWNSNKLSSRLMYNSGDSSLRAGGSGEASDDGAVTGVATFVTFFVSSESDLPAGEVCIGPHFTSFQREGTRIILIQCQQYAFPKAGRKEGRSGKNITQRRRVR